MSMTRRVRLLRQIFPCVAILIPINGGVCHKIPRPPVAAHPLLTVGPVSHRGEPFASAVQPFSINRTSRKKQMALTRVQGLGFVFYSPDTWLMESRRHKGHCGTRRHGRAKGVGPLCLPVVMKCLAVQMQLNQESDRL